MHNIALYIHIPFCMKKCNYCDFASFAGRQELLPAYLLAVEKEMAMQSQRHPNCTVKTVFVGGGTPSLLEPKDYMFLTKAIHRYFFVVHDAEISIEANPGTVTPAKMVAMQAAGFNRISFGVQAVQEDLLAAMGRIHQQADAVESVQMAVEAGFKNINLDLMFGLPKQSMVQWQETLLFAVAAPVQHLSCYSLSIEEGTVWGTLSEKNLLPPVSEELDRRMYHTARALLHKHGFEQYELSNFAKKGFSCRHNLIYWERGDYLGIGAGAHSLMENQRFSNAAVLAPYIQFFNTHPCFSNQDAAVRVEEEIVFHGRQFEGPAEEGVFQDSLQQEKSGAANPETETTATFFSYTDKEFGHQRYASELEHISTDVAVSETMFMGLRLIKGVSLKDVFSQYGVDIQTQYKEEIAALLHDGLITLNNGQMCLTAKGLDFANRVFVAFIS